MKLKERANLAKFGLSREFCQNNENIPNSVAGNNLGTAGFRTTPKEGNFANLNSM